MKGTLVFIHGNSLSARSFSKQLNHFNEYKLHCFELPGHGKNKSKLYNENDYSIEGFVSHLKEFVSDHNLSNYIVVGHSIGGHIAIEAAEELEKLKGIFIYSAPPITKPANLEQAFLPSPLIPLLFQEQLTEDELKRLAAGFTNNVNEQQKIIEQIKDTHNSVRPLIAKGIGELKHKDEKEVVERLQLPVAVVQGENEPFANLNYLQSINWKNLWKDKIHIIKNASHSPHLENPDEFNNLLLQFCETVFV